MIIKQKLWILPFMLLFVQVFLTHSNVFAQSDYTSAVLFTIPWGECVDEISLGWKGEVPPDADWFPAELGPSAIDSTGGFVILDIDVLKKFNIDGTFAGSYDMSEVWACGSCGDPLIDIEQNGYVLVGCGNYIHLLDPQLDLVASIQLPRESISRDEFVRVNGILTSVNGFWVSYTSDASYKYKYRLEYYINGAISTPQLRDEGYLGQDPYYRPMDSYISPTGETFPFFTDMYGYTYHALFITETGYPMQKEDTQGQIIYTHNINWVEDWGNLEYHFTWSGDFFTENGSPDGLVITKYTLQCE